MDSVLESSCQKGAAHAEAATRGTVGNVVSRDGLSVDREGRTRAEGRRVVLTLRSRGHDGGERGSDKTRRRRRVVALGKATASRSAHHACPAEGTDGLAGASDVCREAVLGTAVGGGGHARDAVGDDELETGDHRVLAEDDLELD